MKTYRVGAALCLSVATVFCLGGCTGDADPQGGANLYAAEFEAARSQTDVPEILAILSDGVITDAEYQESVRLTIQCIQDQGFASEDLGDGGISISDINSRGQEAMNQVFRTCDDPRAGLISGLFNSIQMNPQNVNMADLLVACYKRIGVVDQDMTGDELKSSDHSGPPWNPPSDDVMGCLTDPLHYAS